MSVSVYDISKILPPCVYTIPEGQDVQVYLRQVNNILEQFKAMPEKKNMAIERLQTLNALLRAVRTAALTPAPK